MEHFLREWRDAAQSRSQFETAIFVGDKVLALTSSDDDAIRLANLQFSSANYSRAYSILASQNLIPRFPECKYLAAHCQVKQGRFDEALTILGDKTPSALLSGTGDSRRKLARTNGATRGGKGHVPSHGASPSPDAHEQANTRFYAAMCYLRGICYAKQNAFDRAKECYKDAVRIDVQCFEAFDQLMKNALMSPQEEWDFLDSLEFDSTSAESNSSSQQAGEMIKMLYTTRLSKYNNPKEFTAAVETLSTHYKLASNPDLLLARAELFFTQCKFREALSLTESILENDHYNFAALPVHLACLHELNERNALFLIAHDFADRHPEEPATWLAVGVYYLTINKVTEARRYFSKASMMDPHFGPAWIGFAHTFAAEGEHDQAISAYSTAARLFQGTHLPQLFLGMQNLQLNNMPLAREYLGTAYSLCKSDPLLLNEMGVVFYHEERLEEAVNAFNAALNIADNTDADPRAWVFTRANLGHAYRRLQQWDGALQQFEEVLRLGGSRDAGTFCAKGMVLLEKGKALEAVSVLHEALAINPQDPIASELLSKALEESVEGSMFIGSDDLDDGDEGQAETMFAAKKRAAKERPPSNKSRKQIFTKIKGIGYVPKTGETSTPQMGSTNDMDVHEVA
ncbi:hypothetical protein FH972_024450 [Carpinus fangiana]|uniref:Uncharacterized protein n=1 Tax=Carpinus fangiana TaxID=176857 RepID=A0A5N6L0K6_9ROSI|nr:hypothetical protein FH972_024450 [Carpinus fangiana]